MVWIFFFEGEGRAKKNRMTTTPCVCGYCADPIVFLRAEQAPDGAVKFRGDGGLSYPCRIRIIIDGVAIVAVLLAPPPTPVIRFADGAMLRSFSDATVHAHRLCGAVRKQGKWELALWTMNVAHIGSVSLDRLNRALFFSSGKTDIPCGMQCHDVETPVNQYDQNPALTGKMLALFDNKWRPAAPPAPAGPCKRKRKKDAELDESPRAESSDDEPPLTWNVTCAKDTWTAPLLQKFICTHPAKAPILREITRVYLPVGPGNPKVEALFAHPRTNEAISLIVSSVALNFVPQYRSLLEAALLSG